MMIAATVHPAPVPARAAPTLGATLREIHRGWIDEARHRLDPAMAPGADSWDGWSVAQYLGDRFHRQYRRESAMVAALLPLLQVRDASLLRAKGEALERTLRHLSQLGRRQGVAAALATASWQFLDLLRTWFTEIERVAEGLTRDDLPEPGRRALAQLETAAALRP